MDATRAPTLGALSLSRCCISPAVPRRRSTRRSAHLWYCRNAPGPRRSSASCRPAAPSWWSTCSRTRPAPTRSDGRPARVHGHLGFDPERRRHALPDHRHRRAGARRRGQLPARRHPAVLPRAGASPAGRGRAARRVVGRRARRRGCAKSCWPRPTPRPRSTCSKRRCAGRGASAPCIRRWPMRSATSAATPTSPASPR